MTTRRDFLAGAGLAASAILSDASAQEVKWDQGRVVHLLPTVSHDRFLIKASFDTALTLSLIHI